jgi:hypothetical protein
MGRFKELQRFVRYRLVLDVDLPNPGDRKAIAEAIRDTRLPLDVEARLRGLKQVDCFAKRTIPGKATIYLTFEGEGK